MLQQQRSAFFEDVLFAKVPAASIITTSRRVSRQKVAQFVVAPSAGLLLPELFDNWSLIEEAAARAAFKASKLRAGGSEKFQSKLARSLPE